VCNLSVSEARGVIFESDLIFLLVETKFAQAIGIREFAEAFELLHAERGLQLVSNLEKRHGRDYSSSERFVKVAKPGERVPDRIAKRRRLQRTANRETGRKLRLHGDERHTGATAKPVARQLDTI